MIDFLPGFITLEFHPTERRGISFFFFLGYFFSINSDVSLAYLGEGKITQISMDEWKP